MAFDNKFPSAQNVSWDKENDNEWEAEFKMNGKKYSANFSSSGDWMETEYEIDNSEVPAQVSTAMSSQFPAAKSE